MLCLGIESSCDETALALVDDEHVIDSIIASQTDIHALFGGVVPELASREHYRFIGPLFDRLLEHNSINPRDIDLIAVARGPGLLGGLLVGVAFAKALGAALDIPFIGINHLHAHLLAAGIENKLEYPAIGLLASGGHTHIYRIENPWTFILLGTSLDDAAGEAFDKVGKAMGINYPAGKTLDQYAQKGNVKKYPLPRPHLDNQNLDFSFSGLKTAALELLHRENIAVDGAPANGQWQEIFDFCASFNLAIADTLTIKTQRALKANRDVKALWFAGGVAANSMIRKNMEELAAKQDKRLLVPSVAYCTDNASMVAFTGNLLAREGFFHDLSMETIPRGKKIPADMLRKNDNDALA